MQLLPEPAWHLVRRRLRLLVLPLVLEQEVRPLRLSLNALWWGWR